MYFLCIDCGLTNIKTVTIDKNSNIISEHSLPTPRDNHIINITKLYKTLSELVSYAAKELGDKITAISVSGHGNGLYLVGKDYAVPYGYSSMFTDSLPYTPKTEDTFPLTLQTSWSGQPLPILAYIKSEKPELFVQIKSILLCKDMLRYMMTGSVCTDYTDASAAGLLNYKTGDYDTELMKLYGLEDCMSLLPPIKLCTDKAGYVSKNFSKDSGLPVNIPVVTGLFDVNSCMLGSGVIEPDKYCLIAGTWGINCAVSKKDIADKSITQCCIFTVPEKFMCIDSAPTSCSNLEWFLNNILNNADYKKANEIVSNTPVDSELFYLPYIHKPMDLNISGGLLGLNATHTRNDLMRAVYEGIVFEHATRIEKLKKIGIVYQRAVLTGGAAESDVFCQMFADVTGLEIETTSQSQTGALGGYILCLVATGIFPEIKTAIESTVKIKKVYSPQNTKLYKEKYETFKKIIYKENERSF